MNKLTDEELIKMIKQEFENSLWDVSNIRIYGGNTAKFYLRSTGNSGDWFFDVWWNWDWKYDGIQRYVNGKFKTDCFEINVESETITCGCFTEIVGSTKDWLVAFGDKVNKTLEIMSNIKGAKS